MTLTLCSLMHRDLLDLVETQPLKEQFKLWHYAFSQPYELNSELAILKYKIFKSNLKYIKETNNKNLGFTLGLGPFTGYTDEEFNSLLNYNPKPKEKETDSKTISIDLLYEDEMDTENEDNLKDFTNLKTKDHSDSCTKVKEQGFCGSCWAFAVVASVEANAAIKGNQVTLSEQQIIDCNKTKDNNGCKGGMPEDAYNYLLKNSLSSSSDYPYEGENKECKKTKGKIMVKSYDYCAGYLNKRCSFNYLFNSLDNKGPYMSGVTVFNGYAHYKQGHFYDSKCKEPNHAVLVVQIISDSKDGSTGSIKIKNSWGEGWGIKGYGWIKYDQSMIQRGCGLLEEGWFPYTEMVNEVKYHSR